MSDYPDRVHFNDLKACDPGDVTARTGCSYDEKSGIYRADIWGRTYIVDIQKADIRPEKKEGGIHKEYLYLFILHYLLKAEKIPPSGIWVSEKDIVGGAAFFRGPHLLPVQLLVDAFGDDLSSFKLACDRFKGTPIDFADAAFCFQITPAIPVAVLYWQGDDDFPSDARLLFDKTIDRHLPLDIIYALAVEICHTLVT